jgi:tetratricopeptide (TPR) repeat protein
VTPRRRILAIVAAAALLAAGGAILAASQGLGDGHGAKRPSGAPRLALDLGVRTDEEARDLRRAATLYAQGDHAGARELADRWSSVQAQIVSAFARWPAGTLATMQALAATDPNNALVQLHLGLALVWSGDDADALSAFRQAAKDQPDTLSAVTALDFLHPEMVPGEPQFEPSFRAPAAIRKLSSPKQLVALRAAARGDDPHAKILYALALQTLGKRISAQRELDAAARLAPNDPEVLTAAAVGRFSKADPSAAFSRLGPLAKRFPHAATVRFHLGLLLLWIAEVKQAKVELRQTVSDAPHSPLAAQARLLLARLK